MAVTDGLSALAVVVLSQHFLKPPLIALSRHLGPRDSVSHTDLFIFKGRE